MSNENPFSSQLPDASRFRKVHYADEHIGWTYRVGGLLTRMYGWITADGTRSCTDLSTTRSEALNSFGAFILLNPESFGLSSTVGLRSIVQGLR